MKQEITQEIKQAFDGDLKDAVKDFTAYRAMPSDDWAVNDTGTKNHAYKGRGVFGSYSAYETDGQAVSMKDVKLTCLQSELTDTPMIDDVINGMRVLSIKKDPANVSHTIQLRGLHVDDTA